MSAWYLRLTRDGGDIVAQAFLPSGVSPVTEEDFDTQMRLPVFSPSVNNHSTHVDVTLFEPTFPNHESTYGYYDCVNVFSNIPDIDGELNGIEFGKIEVRKIA